VPRDDMDGLSPRALFCRPERKRGVPPPGDAVPSEARDVSPSLDRTKWGGDAVPNEVRDVSLTLGTM
jgi:hypothetical protein